MSTLSGIAPESVESGENWAGYSGATDGTRPFHGLSAPPGAGVLELIVGGEVVGALGAVGHGRPDRIVLVDVQDPPARARTGGIGAEGEAVRVQRLRVLVGMADGADPVSGVGFPTGAGNIDAGTSIRRRHRQRDELDRRASAIRQAVESRDVPPPEMILAVAVAVVGPEAR